MAGKVSRRLLEDRVLNGLATGQEVLWGPRVGGDFAAIALDEQHVLVTACDPLAVSPALGMARSAWLAFHLVTVDVAVSGLPPAYLTASWSLPEDLPDAALSELLDAFRCEADRFDVQIIAGHTARYAEAAFPWVGGATAIGTGARALLRLPSTAEPGDMLMLSGSPGLEAAVLLTLLHPCSASPDRLTWAEQCFDQLSSLKIATQASRIGELRCMHDVTEGGILGASQELALAMDRGVLLDMDALSVDPLVEEILKLSGLSPWEVTSCGTLLAVAPPTALRSLENLGFRVVGEVLEERASFTRSHGAIASLDAPDEDPFWNSTLNPGTRSREGS